MPAGARSRDGRARRYTSGTYRVVVALAIVVLVALPVLAYQLFVGSSEPTFREQEMALSTRSEPSPDVPLAVEVPSVIGARLDDARIVLETAGLEVRFRSTDDDSVLVDVQDPPAGTIASQGSVVALTTVASSRQKLSLPRQTRSVVVIDPGHQRQSNMALEPIGPSAKETKPRVMGGTQGAVTGVPEYEVALQISMNLKERLENRGVEVVMTRTTNDVNIPNSLRAGVANEAKATLFVRIHGDGSPDESMSGITTLYQGPNRWTRPYVKQSRRAATLVHKSVVAATGAVDRGMRPRTDLSGFNYAEVPSILVECGFMSNPVEDRLLTSPHYQDKLAIGIADGVVAYLNELGK